MLLLTKFIIDTSFTLDKIQLRSQSGNRNSPDQGGSDSAVSNTCLINTALMVSYSGFLKFLVHQNKHLVIILQVAQSCSSRGVLSQFNIVVIERFRSSFSNPHKSSSGCDCYPSIEFHHSSYSFHICKNNCASPIDDFFSDIFPSFFFAYGLRRHWVVLPFDLIFPPPDWKETFCSGENSESSPISLP